ncbi:AAA family ATPase [Flavobacterium sp.]|uniref:McrB family protein n=1 Tax=Flavobacterium sp. TaxID=239 RepID=UPI002869F1E2|nr:AAA family ATPase [Flavobacterium sp.]
MAKYFSISIDPLISTFSKIESGKEVIFKVDTEKASPQVMSPNDIIVASVNDQVYYNFIVTEIKGDSINLKKTFEIEKNISFKINTTGVFEEITKDQYQDICSRLFSDYNNSGSVPIKKVTAGNLKESFADWFIKLDKVKHNYFTDSFGSNRDKLLEQLTKYDTIYKEQFGTSVFSLPQNELSEFINELESNLYSDKGEFFEFSLKTSTHMPRAILGKKNYIKFLKELLIESKTASANSPKVNPVNKIYFGAPGTGKSYKITEDLQDVDTIFQKRITFHPEYDNTSFVGGYKPITDSNGEIKYKFVPQIFTNSFVESCNDPEHQYYLIIEEINRGNCAEIFGELFQLLDRDENYKITPSNELINYLNESIPNSKFYVDGNMLLPDNLSIIATMNTSDQSLFPMDSAFKRRWDWEYIPICYELKDDFGKINDSNDFEIDIEDGEKYSWIEFIKKVNLNHIKNNRSLGMDKCIGNYFIKPDNNKTISLKPFINKVIFYLWNDVFKDEDNLVFEENTSYEDFFPIDKKGMKKVKELFERIKLEPIVKPYVVAEESEPRLRQAAEGREEQDS